MQTLILFFCCVISALILVAFHFYKEFKESTEALDYLYYLVIEGTPKEIQEERKSMLEIEKNIEDMQ